MFTSVILFELTFVCGALYGSQFMFVHMALHLFQYYLLKRLLFPLNCLCSFVENQLSIYVWVYFWTFKF